MGFSIWVADDPELRDKKAVSRAPHFSVSRAAMGELRDEMEEQRMLDVSTTCRGKPHTAMIPMEKLCSNDGWRISAREITASLAHAKTAPIRMNDSEGRELWRDWLKFLRVAAKKAWGSDCLLMCHMGLQGARPPPATGQSKEKEERTRDCDSSADSK